MRQSARTSNCLSLGLLLAGTVAQADITPEQLTQASAAVQPQVVEWRRWFHQHPELSNREAGTAAYISENLRAMGIEHQGAIAGHGIVAWIEGGKPGPLVAIRTDMDGLPVTEQTGLPFASQARSEYNGQETGVMHACGHDTHMAMVLGATRVLHEMREQLSGRVMVIFQPAEEGPPAGEKGGASLMLEEGIFEEAVPDAVFGIHVGIGVPGGRLATRPGPLMAASDRFLVRVLGRQTHGARPWDGVDPIVTAAQIITSMQSIASRQLDVTQAPSIISVGRIQGGIRNNVIPDQVEFEGTIRSFDPDMRSQIHHALERTARAVAESAGATVEFELELGNPPVHNDEALTARMLPVLEQATGQPVLMLNPQTVAEDFSEYGRHAPSLFLFLGNWPDDMDPETAPTNHSPQFDVHEPFLETGVTAFTAMVVDYLQ